jgi:pyruvate dehydrogenase (quinone)
MANVPGHDRHRARRLGVKQIWGVVGDALNPVADAIRREDRLEWIGVRHEETGALRGRRAGQVTGTLGVCMGTVGPGSLHLLNGSDFFQEVNNDAVFADVAVFCRTLSSSGQLPGLLEQAVQRALDAPGVALLTLPGDVGGLEAEGAAPHFVTGHGARHARDEVLALADRLAAPMVLTLKAKEALERDNPFAVGQSGLIGNPAAQHAFESCDLLLMLATDFPIPTGIPRASTSSKSTRAARTSAAEPRSSWAWSPTRAWPRPVCSS